MGAPHSQQDTNQWETSPRSSGTCSKPIPSSSPARAGARAPQSKLGMSQTRGCGSIAPRAARLRRAGNAASFAGHSAASRPARLPSCQARGPARPATAPTHGAGGSQPGKCPGCIPRCPRSVSCWGTRRGYGAPGSLHPRRHPWVDVTHGAVQGDNLQHPQPVLPQLVSTVPMAGWQLPSPGCKSVNHGLQLAQPRGPAPTAAETGRSHGARSKMIYFAAGAGSGRAGQHIGEGRLQGAPPCSGGTLWTPRKQKPGGARHKQSCPCPVLAHACAQALVQTAALAHTLLSPGPKNQTGQPPAPLHVLPVPLKTLCRELPGAQSRSQPCPVAARGN